LYSLLFIVVVTFWCIVIQFVILLLFYDVILLDIVVDFHDRFHSPYSLLHSLFTFVVVDSLIFPDAIVVLMPHYIYHWYIDCLFHSVIHYDTFVHSLLFIDDWWWYILGICWHYILIHYSQPLFVTFDLLLMHSLSYSIVMILLRFHYICYSFIHLFRYPFIHLMLFDTLMIDDCCYSLHSYLHSFTLFILTYSVPLFILFTVLLWLTSFIYIVRYICYSDHLLFGDSLLLTFI